VEALRDHRSVLLQAPTGAGKTEMAVEVARRHRDKVVWFVCHRHEIVAQTSAALKRSGADSHGVVAPRYPEDPTIKIQVCSIGALRHRFKRYPPPDLIVLDECHHVAASSWAKLVEHFPDAKLLGLTATPERLDSRGLDDWFEHMIVGPDTRTLIDEGYLSKFKYFAPTIPDLRGVHVRGKEYDRDDLEKAMSKHTLVGDVIDHYKRLTPSARALAFCISVEAARELAARFNKAGIPAKCVDWKTPQAKRDKAVADLASGKIRVLTNKEVFTEGFDLPAIDAVLLLRPTKSFALYRQMIGRCLRVAKGKSHTSILDHAALIDDHPFPDNDVEWSLSGRKSGVTQTSRPTGGVEIRRCPECSAVHKWSAKCPECGYVYLIKDRTIEEVYGELREITQGAEYEGQARFARRCKLHQSTIWNYVIQKQLVTYGPRRLIKVKEGLARVEWLRENAGSFNAPPFGVDSTKYEPQGAFGKRVGIDRDLIRHLIKRGLPKAKNGWVCIEDGLQWLKREGLLTKDGKYNRQRPRSMPGFDKRWGFAKRLGADIGTIANLIKKGLPINELRLIPIDAAMQWLRHKGRLTREGKYISQRHEITDEEIKQAIVMRRQGCTWEAIGEHFGVRGSSIFGAVKRRGIKLPDNRCSDAEDSTTGGGR